MRRRKLSNTPHSMHHIHLLGRAASIQHYTCRELPRTCSRPSTIDLHPSPNSLRVARSLTMCVLPFIPITSPRFSAAVQCTSSLITVQETTNPIVSQATDAESAQLQILPSHATSSAPSVPPNTTSDSSAAIPRFCSVRGCKDVLPGERPLPSTLARIIRTSLALAPFVARPSPTRPPHHTPH